jgi:hypothetical protein
VKEEIGHHLYDAIWLRNFFFFFSVSVLFGLKGELDDAHHQCSDGWKDHSKGIPTGREGSSAPHPLSNACGPSSQRWGSTNAPATTFLPHPPVILLQTNGGVCICFATGDSDRSSDSVVKVTPRRHDRRDR